MSWSEIKHAINNTLGTQRFKPLNEILIDRTEVSRLVKVTDTTGFTNLYGGIQYGSETYDELNNGVIKKMTINNVPVKVVCEIEGAINIGMYFSNHSTRDDTAIGISKNANATTISQMIKTISIENTETTTSHEYKTPSSILVYKGDVLYFYVWSSYYQETGGPSITFDGTLNIYGTPVLIPQGFSKGV